MSHLITVNLKDPVTLRNNEVLSSVTLKKSTTGELALARAAVVRDKRFGREMVDDDLTLALFIIPKITVNSNVVTLPSDWVFLTSEDDLAQLATAYGALRAGYASVEDFEEAQKAKQAALDAGDPEAVAEQQAQEQLPAGEAPTQ